MELASLDDVHGHNNRLDAAAHLVGDPHGDVNIDKHHYPPLAPRYSTNHPRLNEMRGGDPTSSSSIARARTAARTHRNNLVSRKQTGEDGTLYAELRISAAILSFTWFQEHGCGGGSGHDTEKVFPL